MANTLSPTALYGPVLTNEEQYQKDTAGLPRLTPDEERAVIAQARTGNPLARETLVFNCVDYVKTVARKYAAICAASGRKRIEYLDLVQIGNMTVLERLDKALAHPNPIGYLKKTASGEIIKHCCKHASLITTPQERGGTFLSIVDVTSTDAPLPSTDERLTLADVVAAPVITEPPVKEYRLLYHAIRKLTPKQCMVILRHYGLEGAPEDLFTISCSIRQEQGQPYKDSANAAYSIHKSALVALRKQIA